MSDRYAVVDVGTNTVRLLVADAADGNLAPIETDTAMVRLGRALGDDGRIGAAKIAEVGECVAGFVERARRLGARDVRVLGTAAAREAANAGELRDAVRQASGVPLEIVDEDEEARLSFLGALSRIIDRADGDVAVVDVGGGSTEIIVGTGTGRIAWARSFRLGSSRISDAFLHHDPPRETEIESARRRIEDTLDGAEGLPVPVPGYAVAVGGSATNVRRLVGPLLDADALERALRLLADRPSSAIARQFDVAPERARILAGGALVLEGAARRLGAPLHVVDGGIREGALLDLLGRGARAAAVPSGPRR